MNEEEYNDIRNYLKNGITPEKYVDSHGRFGFKRKCKTYELEKESNELYYMQTKKDGSIKRNAKVLMDNETKERFLEIHNPQTHSHLGLNKTIQTISKKYFWPRMTYDITKWIHNCPVCLLVKDGDKTKLKQVKVSEPWEILSMDIIGPVNETSEGYKFIFSATDYYSKWVEAFPICNKFPADVAACLKLIFYRHGACKCVLSDECADFISEVNHELCKQLGIPHNVKAVYHPDVKTFDQKCAEELRSSFINLVMEHAFDWPHYIDGLLFNMRTKKHQVTKFSPFFLLHKREARMPPILNTDPVASISTEFDLGQILQPNYGAKSTSKSRLQDARTHQVLIDYMQTSENNQTLANAREQAAEPKFVAGEKVLLINGKKRPYDDVNPDPSYAGPYVISEIKANKVRLMSLRDFTQIKVMQDFDKVIHYRESFKLSMFE